MASVVMLLWLFVRRGAAVVEPPRCKGGLLLSRSHTRRDLEGGPDALHAAAEELAGK